MNIEFPVEHWWTLNSPWNIDDLYLKKIKFLIVNSGSILKKICNYKKSLKEWRQIAADPSSGDGELLGTAFTVGGVFVTLPLGLFIHLLGLSHVLHT